jgi:hypothetical protein
VGEIENEIRQRAQEALGALDGLDVRRMFPPGGLAQTIGSRVQRLPGGRSRRRLAPKQATENQEDLMARFMLLYQSDAQAEDLMANASPLGLVDRSA